MDSEFKKRSKSLRHSSLFTPTNAPSPSPTIIIFDLLAGSAVSLTDDSDAVPFHTDKIRAIRFDPKGKLFVSAGGDKIDKVWLKQSWRFITSVSSENRVFAVAISDDGTGVVELVKNNIIDLQCFCKNSFCC